MVEERSKVWTSLPGSSKLGRILSGTLCCLIFSALLADGSYLTATDSPGELFKWIGPDGTPLPFASPVEVEEFLLTARISGVKDIPEGVTRPRKLLLEKDGIRMYAIFRDVELFKKKWNSPRGPKFDFRDSCRFELAAYRLSKLLGISHVPPVVSRKLEKKDFADPRLFGKFEKPRGTLQAWVENAMTEKARMEQQLKPPNIAAWAYQLRLMQLFDNLIYNDDRTQGNILIGPDWKIWFIDATRAFRPIDRLSSPEDLLACDRLVWEQLKKLDPERLENEMEDLLSQNELRCLIARHAKLVAHIEGLISERGEDAVLLARSVP